MAVRVLAFDRCFEKTGDTDDYELAVPGPGGTLLSVQSACNLAFKGLNLNKNREPNAWSGEADFDTLIHMHEVCLEPPLSAK
jgi:hypothetical protein